MKLLKSILILILVLSFVSCKKEASDKKPNATGTSYATLIAYSIHGKHKRSDATLQLNEIGSIHIVRLPSRTQPIMALGDSIKVNAVIDYNSNLTDYKEFFKQSIVKETLKSMTITNND